MKGFASVALRPLRVMLAVTNQLSVLLPHAPGGVAVAFTPATNLEVAHRVEIRRQSSGRHGRLLALTAGHGQRSGVLRATEDHSDVGDRHPVLQHRTGVEILPGRASVQRAERDEAAGERVGVGVPVRAQRLLLVLLGDGGFVGPVVHAAALRGVKLIRSPRAPVVHALVDGQRLGPRRTELQADVGDLELLAERQRQRHVERRTLEVLRLPAGEVVGRV